MCRQNHKHKYADISSMPLEIVIIFFSIFLAIISTKSIKSIIFLIIDVSPNNIEYFYLIFEFLVSFLLISYILWIPGISLWNLFDDLKRFRRIPRATLILGISLSMATLVGGVLFPLNLACTEYFFYVIIIVSIFFCLIKLTSKKYCKDNSGTNDCEEKRKIRSLNLIVGFLYTLLIVIPPFILPVIDIQQNLRDVHAYADWSTGNVGTLQKDLPTYWAGLGLMQGINFLLSYCNIYFTLFSFVPGFPAITLVRQWSIIILGSSFLNIAKQKGENETTIICTILFLSSPIILFLFSILIRHLLSIALITFCLSILSIKEWDRNSSSKMTGTYIVLITSLVAAMITHEIVALAIFLGAVISWTFLRLNYSKTFSRNILLLMDITIVVTIISFSIFTIVNFDLILSFLELGYGTIGKNLPSHGFYPLIISLIIGIIWFFIPYIRDSGKMKLGANVYFLFGFQLLLIPFGTWFWIIIGIGFPFLFLVLLLGFQKSREDQKNIRFILHASFAEAAVLISLHPVFLGYSILSSRFIIAASIHSYLGLLIFIDRYIKPSYRMFLLGGGLIVNFVIFYGFILNSIQL